MWNSAATMCQGGKPVVFYKVVYRSSTASAAGKPSSRFWREKQQSTDLTWWYIHMTKNWSLLLWDQLPLYFKKHCFFLRCCLYIYQFYILVVCQITYKLNTGPKWWGTRGLCPTRQQTLSHGCRSRWPTVKLFRPSCWSVGFHYS